MAERLIFETMDTPELETLDDDELTARALEVRQAKAMLTEFDHRIAGVLNVRATEVSLVSKLAALSDAELALAGVVSERIAMIRDYRERVRTAQIVGPAGVQSQEAVGAG